MTQAAAPTHLRLFLDSAEIDRWRRHLALGIFHGVTTNPLLLERAGVPCTVDSLRRLACEAAAQGAREIHLQTWGDTAEEMAARGRDLAACADQGLDVAVKVPATAAGLAAAAALRREGAAVTLTAVFNPGQVLAAASLGAAYAAPYLGRMDDAGRDGLAQILAMHRILTGTASPVRLLVASLRRPEQVLALAAEGLDTFTLTPELVEPLLQDELTEKAAAAFAEAARIK
ncbi:transaldolase [bacterium]|nr:transaldolase [bacterium]